MQMTRMLDSERTQRAILFAFGGVIFLAKLWEGPLGGDEACYALLSREILRSGDWWVLHHPVVEQWANFYEHPPLYMWVTALFYSVLGISDGAAKLFSALSGFATLLALYVAARRMVGHRFAMVAATILVTSLYFVDYARKARLEIPLTLFLFLPFLFLLVAAQSGRRRWAVAAGLSMGLAVLVKGVPGFAAGGVVLASLALGAYDERRWDWRGILGFGTGAAVLLVPWALGQWIWDQGRFFDWYLHHQLAWSVEGRPDPAGAGSHALSLWFYSRKLFTEVMVPGAWVAAVGAVELLRRRRLQEDRWVWLALVASLTVVGAFSLLSFHKARYILPAVPFLALVGAFACERRGWTPGVARGATAVLGGSGALLVLALLLTPVHLYSKKDGDFLPFVDRVQEVVSEGEAFLVGGMAPYTVEQVFTWYFDRPQEIVLDAREFGDRWAEGHFSAGILKVGAADFVPDNPVARSGPYLLYLREGRSGATLGSAPPASAFSDEGMP